MFEWFRIRNDRLKSKIYEWSRTALKEKGNFTDAELNIECQRPLFARPMRGWGGPR